MSNNPQGPDDEFDPGLDDESFDDFGAQPGKSTLGGMMQDNPAAKIAMALVAVAVIFGLIFMFGGSDKTTAPSVLPTGSDVKTPPGTTESTPAFIEAVQEQNEANTEQAIREGGSVLPTPIDPPVGRISLPGNQQEEDPLQRWRRLQEERLRQSQQQSQSLQPEPVDQETTRQEAVKQMAEVMSKQMNVILQNKDVPPTQTVSVTSPEWLAEKRAREEEEAKAKAEAEAAAVQEEEQKKAERPLIAPGEILYAQTLTEANSESPGPVLAQIAVGPLAGARLLGSFETQEETLTLSFNTMVVEGTSYGINAIALDPDTTLPGMATEVDHRYLQRVFLPMAAAFIEGLASGIQDSGRTTVTIQGETVAEETQSSDRDQKVASGVEEAGQEARDILDEIAGDTKTLIIVESGTPFGLLFLDPVTDKSAY